MPFQPSRSVIARELADDLLSGNAHADESDLYYIEPQTALDWSIAPDQADTVDQRFVDAISDLGTADCKKLAALVPALLGDITADQLLELRDLLRSAYITHARREIQFYMAEHAVFDNAVCESLELVS